MIRWGKHGCILIVGLFPIKHIYGFMCDVACWGFVVVAIVRKMDLALVSYGVSIKKGGLKWGFFQRDPLGVVFLGGGATYPSG